MLDHQEYHIVELFTEIYAVECRDVLLICISPCFEEQTKIKTECGIFTLIYISPEKHQRLVEMKNVILNMMQKILHVLLTVFELEIINFPNFQLLLQGFGPFRDGFGPPT